MNAPLAEVTVVEIREKWRPSVVVTVAALT